MRPVIRFRALEQFCPANGSVHCTDNVAVSKHLLTHVAGLVNTLYVDAEQDFFPMMDISFDSVPDESGCLPDTSTP